GGRAGRAPVAARTRPARTRARRRRARARSSPAKAPASALSGPPCGPASAPLPKFVIRRGTLSHELRKQRGTSKHMILVPLFDLKFLNELAAGGVGDLNWRAAAPAPPPLFFPNAPRAFAPRVPT